MNHGDTLSMRQVILPDGHLHVVKILDMNKPSNLDEKVDVGLTDSKGNAIPVILPAGTTPGERHDILLKGVVQAIEQRQKTNAAVEESNATGKTNLNAAEAEQHRAVAANMVPSTPTYDGLGVVYTPVPGGPKGKANLQKSFKTDADSLAKTEGTFQQFESVLSDINAGKDVTGAQSVIALFNAIGLSATPLKGMGFKINNSTVAEHVDARGVGQQLYQKLLGLKNGDVITPQQIEDYAQLALQARHDAYVNKINEYRSYGGNAVDLLPAGNGKKWTPTQPRSSSMRRMATKTQLVGQLKRKAGHCDGRHIRSDPTLFAAGAANRAVNSTTGAVRSVDRRHLRPGRCQPGQQQQQPELE
jgi:hypothetical protein